MRTASARRRKTGIIRADADRSNNPRMYTANRSKYETVERCQKLLVRLSTNGRERPC